MDAVSDTSGSESRAVVEGEQELEPALSESTTVHKTENENKNKDMENIDAMDIVKDMRIGWNIGNTLDATRTDIPRTDQPLKFDTAWGNPGVTQDLIDGDNGLFQGDAERFGLFDRHTGACRYSDLLAALLRGAE